MLKETNILPLQHQGLLAARNNLSPPSLVKTALFVLLLYYTLQSDTRLANVVCDLS